MTAASPRRMRLVWRIYLYGMLMLVLSMGASILVGRYVLQPAFEVPVRPSTTWIAWHAAQIQDEPERLRAELTDLRARVGIELSLYDANGALTVSSAEHPPPPLSADDVRGLHGQRTVFDSGRGRVGIFDQSGTLTGYALVSFPQISPFTLALGQLAAALIVLALFAVPLARSIVLPVERLARVTRAFGNGDLGARFGLGQRRDELGDLALAFDEMAERVAALRRTELELLANVSHELRTPLSRIRLALDLLADGKAERASAHVQDIAEELEELENLINDVMIAARLDLGRSAAIGSLPPLHKKRVRGRELVEASVARFRRMHPERDLSCRFEQELPWLEVDPVLVRRAVDNLLDNAAKFSDVDTAIDLAAGASAEKLRLTITDRGIGIPAADQTRVFEPFYRTDRSRDRATGGVGLGLALARRIIEAHAGTIHLDSAIAQGSCFRVELPAAPAQVAPSDSERREANAGHDADSASAAHPSALLLRS